jgi:hypothetical protein
MLSNPTLTKETMTSRQSVLAVTMLLSIVMVSPLFVYLGIRGTFIVAASVAVTLIAFGGAETRFTAWFVFVSLFIMVLAGVPAIYWMDFRYVPAPVFFLFSLFLIQLADDRAIEMFVTLSTSLIFIVLLGAVIGFVLVTLGMQPLFEIPNNDGRPNYFFGTTFSNSWWGGIIRPSGIFDEAGMLSFMVCGVAALRALRGRNMRVTWLLLILGFVTLSLAHLVYVTLHFAAERLRFQNLIGIIATLLPIVLLAGYLGGFEILEKRLLTRATITEAGQIVGDNRSSRMLNAFQHLDENPESILFGAHPSCRFDYLKCKEKFPLMGENPLSPMVFQGLFMSWPYYLALGFLFLSPLFGRRYIVSMAIGALLLQRPYFLDISYSLIALLVIAVTMNSIASRFGKQPIFFRRHPQDSCTGRSQSVEELLADRRAAVSTSYERR